MTQLQEEFDQGPPLFAEADIERLAISLYGCAPGVKLFPSERDQNARASFADGRQILLKIANAGEARQNLEFQHAMLNHVSRRDPALGLPRVAPTAAGQDIAQVVAADGAVHYVRALTWVSGEPLARVARRDVALWRSLGETLGRLSNALQGFFHPAAYRPNFLWNLDNTGHAFADVDCVADRATRDCIVRFLATRYEQAGEVQKNSRKSVLYQDANDHNVIVTDNRVVGLIDFGDAVFGAQVNELAIALAYSGLNESNWLDVFSAIVEGYSSAFSIQREEIEILLDLVIARLAQSVCISSARAARFPDNAYLTMSQQPAQALLAKLLNADQTAAAKAFQSATRAGAGGARWREKPEEWAPERLAARRKARIAPSLSVAYDQPLTIVRGEGAYLIDADGRRYLDMVNNVAHVGHCHPAVVDALSRQASLLNTNARYLHKTLLDYADRLVASMPENLSVCVFTCSGSEANELALRMARTYTGRHDAVVLDMAYHGHTSALIDISPYKFARKGGAGRMPFVHVAPMPDGYRGPHKGANPEAGRLYADGVAKAVQRASNKPAFFIAESFLGVGGQVIPPPEFLKSAYQSVRAAGGVCIADEVQVGFGRAGSHMWAFQTQGVAPDIVTLGKPIGAGHPLAAVITTPEIAREFANGMEYFNTFGGNPVSCAVGMAVLDVIEREGLQDRAATLGAYLIERLTELASRHPIIGDVRGCGLFIGVELVDDLGDLTPATAKARRVTQALRARGVLLSTDGPFENVLKIKPPMVIRESDCDFFIDELQRALSIL